MNQRVTSPGTANGRRAWLFFSLLLPALASKVSTQHPSPPIQADSDAPPYPQNDSRPYLRVISTPPLRFEDLLPPPDLSVRPPAGAPPKFPAKEKTGPDVVLPPKPPAAAAAAAASAKANEIHAGSTTAAAPAPPVPSAILPDDVPSQVRAEDFLPYFQYPGAGRRVRGEGQPPAAPSLPASTATYTQGE
jgi:hypothetical protein